MKKVSKAQAKNEKRKKAAAQKLKEQEAKAKQPVAGYSEVEAVKFLRSELTNCESLVRAFGDPPPQDAVKFLSRMSSSLLKFLPSPPPEVKAEVVDAFTRVGWDIGRGGSVEGAPVPTGACMCSLVNRLHNFFRRRLEGAR